jgi:L-ascorbate metabolism protein UlaG (beta-lactamase superfamily)
MTITKYGHSCLLVEIDGTFILTDPGKWNSMPTAKPIDAILITHEHADHCDIEQIKSIQKENPDVTIITHAAVGKLLEDVGITYTNLEPGNTTEIKGVSIESFGGDHAIVYGTVSPCRNTGYLIDGKLFAPGDALHDIPGKQIEVLALPCGGPWMRLSEAIDYAKQLNPKVVFPIHDAIYTEVYRSDLIPRIVGGNLESAGITFIDMAAGATHTF